MTGAATDQDKALKMNAINVIAPYKHHGQWVFDDPHVGLVQEPFVAGADTWIDRVVSDIPNAARGFTLIFSGFFGFALSRASIPSRLAARGGRRQLVLFGRPQYGRLAVS